MQIWTRKYVYLWNLTCTWSDTIRPCQNTHRNAPGGQILNFQNTLIGLETRLGGRTDRKFLQNPNLNEIIHKAQQHLIWFVNLILSFRKPFLSFYIYLLLIWLFRFIFIFLCCFLTTERVYCKIREIATFLEALEFRLIWLVKIVWMAKEEMST